MKITSIYQALLEAVLTNVWNPVLPISGRLCSGAYAIPARPKGRDSLAV